MDRFQEAAELTNQGRIREARDILEEIVSQDPDNADALYSLGMCFTLLSEPDKAVNALERSIELQPDLANAHVALGVAFSMMKNTDKAKECFLSALRLDARNAFALRNLGALFRGTGEIDKSLYYLRKAYGIDPSDPGTVYGLGYACQVIGDWEKADRCYRQVLTMNAPEAIADSAKNGLQELAGSDFKGKSLRTDAVFHLLDALRRFEHATAHDIRQVAMEIAVTAQGGLDINDPDKLYTLDSLDGQFTMLQLMCYMYAGFAKVEPSFDLGLPLADEYCMARQLFAGGDIL